MRLQPNITLKSRQRQSGAEMKILASSKTGLWINETITKKRNELRDCVRSMETATPESTPRIKFDNDEVNNSLGPKRVLSVSHTKTVWGWYDHPSTSSSSSSWQAASWWKSSSWKERQFLFNGLEVFSLTCNVDSIVSNGVYTRHQTRTQCHVPAHVIFLAQCSIACLVSVSHMHNMCMLLKGLTAQALCLHKNIRLHT